MAEYISRDAVITTIKNYGKGAIAEGMKTLDPVDDIVALAGAIEWLQVADVAPVAHGKWIGDVDSMICSECGMKWNYCDNDVGDFCYCPNCGSKNGYEVSE